MKFLQINKKPSLKEISLFFQQLHTLISASIPLQQICQLLLNTQSNLILQKVIITLKTEIEAGHGLAYGLRKFPDLFNVFICSLVKIGETSGTLEKILQQISSLTAKSLHLRNQIRQALFYPMIVLIISLLVCLLMLIFIVPKFNDFFHDLHSELPWITKVIVKLSNCIREEYLIVITGLTLIIFCFKYFKSSLSLKQYIRNLAYNIPLVKHLMTRFFILYFVKNLSIIYSSGVTITDGLKLIAQLSDYPKHQLMILKLRDRILSGNQLHISMRFCIIFPPIIIQMVRIGEETGTLHTMLAAIEDLYEAELDRIILKMNLLLEPLIMVILGVLIGGLVIAMYLPVFRIGMAI